MGHNLSRFHLPPELLQMVFAHASFADHRNAFLAFEQDGYYRTFLRPRIANFLTLQGADSRLGDLPQALNGTGLWLQNTAQYQQWENNHDGKHNLLLTGIAGTGKSTLMKFAFEEIQRQGFRAIGHVCSSTLITVGTQMTALVPLYKSLVHQLVVLLDRWEYRRFVRTLRDDHEGIFGPNRNHTRRPRHLHRLFTGVVRTLIDPVYCFIDNISNIWEIGGRGVCLNLERMPFTFRTCFTDQRWPSAVIPGRTITIEMETEPGHLDDTAKVTDHELQAVNISKRIRSRLYADAQGNMAWVMEATRRIKSSPQPVRSLKGFEDCADAVLLRRIHQSRASGRVYLLYALMLHGQPPLRWEDFYFLMQTNHLAQGMAASDLDEQIMEAMTGGYLHGYSEGLVMIKEDGTFGFRHNAVERIMRTVNLHQLLWLAPLMNPANGYAALAEKWSRYTDQSFEVFGMSFPEYAQKQVRYYRLCEKRARAR